jgi:Ca2+-binding RTX toxin-like protein
MSFDGGAGTSDRLDFFVNGTFDLQSMTLTGVEQLRLFGSTTTALIDADALSGLTSISGNVGTKLVTAEATMNLTGKTVTSVIVESTNAAGTTFTVSASGTAFQIFGGPGGDTIETSSFAFTATQREAIFGGSSIEVIRDTSGFYGDESANTIVGTAVADSIQGGGGADRLIGAGGPDSLSGGAGGDTFVFNLASEGMDTISDFVSGSDNIEIAVSGFGGGLTAGGSVVLMTGADYTSIVGGPGGCFIYDTGGADAGTVYWDADGGVGANAMPLMKLQGVPGLSATDFDLV